MSTPSAATATASATAPAPDAAPVLSVRQLGVAFRTERGVLPAVEAVSFDLARDEVLGIVGESGSGKSVTALAVMRLLPAATGLVTGGQVLLQGQDLLTLSEKQMRRVRGGVMSMIFQEPMSSLNPVFTIGNQITEAITAHEAIGARAARERAIELLHKVGIPTPARRIDDYPHQLSGGQRQRVMIAAALACSPRVLLADEPTTALDVTIQAQILELLRSLQREFQMSVVMITHNMGVIADFADRVLVMYAGRVIESAGVHEIFDAPRHPYSRALLASVPQLDDDRHRLHAIAGSLPSPAQWPVGCRFAPRCPQAEPRCTQDIPLLRPIAGHGEVACVLAQAALGSATP
jgi:peptide/nickel transport system ATP-binding protein/oligopeptide transport system ATP-binding protein